MDHLEVPPDPLVLAGRRRPTLRGRDLRGANLRGADLRGMRLKGLDLSDARLQGADLRGARLFGGSLRGAQLDGSRWAGAALVGVEGLEQLLGRPELADAAIVGRDPVEVMFGVPAGVGALAFSADGELLAAIRGQTVEIVDAGNGRRVRVLNGYGGQVRDVAFGSEPTVLATASDDGAVRIWDVSAGTVLDTLTEPDNPYPRAVAYSPDGARLAVTPDHGPPRLWDPAARTMVVLPGLDEAHHATVFSADGTLLAAATRWEIQIFEVATGTARTTLQKRRGWWAAWRKRRHASAPPLAMAFTPDGTRLGTVAKDGTEGFWILRTGTRHETTGAEPQRRTAAACLPDSRFAVTAFDGKSHRLLVRDVVSGSESGVVRLASTPDASALACSRDGARIAVGTRDGRLHIVRHHYRGQRGTSSGRIHSDRLDDLAFSPDGETVAVASEDGTIRLWDVATGDLRAARTGKEGGYSVAYAPDGAAMAVAQHDTVRLWEIRTRELRATLGGPGTVAHTLAYSPDGHAIVAVSDGRGWIADAVTGETLATMTEPAHRILGAALAPDATRVTLTSLRHLTLWNVLTNEAHDIAAIPEDYFTGPVAYSPDGSVLATAVDRLLKGAEVWLWKPASATPHTTLSGHLDDINALALSPDGTLLATASADGTARIWDLATGTARFVLRGHADALTTVAFSPDGSLLATGSWDGTARIWNVAAGESVVRLVTMPGRRGAAVFDDGSYRLDGKAGNHFWWAVKLCRFAPGELDPYVPVVRAR